MSQPKHGNPAVGSAGPTVAEVGEDALVAAIVARLASGPTHQPAQAAAARVLVGPGDDAAVVSLSGDLVISTDTLVEGVDFRQDWSQPAEVGQKAAVQVLADVEAMGAVPVGLLIALVVPGPTPLDWCLGLAEGLAEQAHAAGVHVLGGDVADGPCLMLTGTATGVLEGQAPATTRGGAKPGDVVALSASTGASAAGLALLLAGRTSGERLPPSTRQVAERALAAHRAPHIDHTAGARARQAGATAMIDVSDGLIRDATRVAAASAVRIDLMSAALAPDEDLRLLADLLSQDGREWVLTSGEEHAMLACFSRQAPLPYGFTVIGRVLPVGADGDSAVSVDGVRRRDVGGWTHFGRRP